MNYNNLKKRNSLVIFFLAIATICCTISLLSPYFSPAKFWIGGLTTIVISVLPIGILLLLVASLLMRQKALVLINVILLIFNISYFDKLWSFTNECIYSENSRFTVMTFNVSFFNVKKVFSSEYYDQSSNPKGQELMQYVTSQSAEIICLQEFFNDSSYAPFNLTAQMKSRGYDYYFLSETKQNNGIDRGIITFSKFPIVASGQIFLGKNRYNGALYTDIKYKKDTLRVINVHLESMELYFNQKGIFNQAKYGLGKFKQASTERYSQTKQLLSFIENSPHPTLLLGDFNELPISYNLLKVQKKLSNTFQQVGSGFGNTLTIVDNIIPLQIDHIFLGEELRAECLIIDNNITASDHYPVISTISK